MLSVDKASIHLVDQGMEDHLYFHLYEESDAMAAPAVLQTLLRDAPEYWHDLPRLASVLAYTLDNHCIGYGISSRPLPNDGRLIMPCLAVYLHDYHVEIYTGGGGLVPQFSFDTFMRLDKVGWDSR